MQSRESATPSMASSTEVRQPPEGGVSLRTADSRYTVWPDGSEELYDLRGDPQAAAHYGRLRAWGSVSFVVVVLATGVLLDEDFLEFC